jgi:3-oxoacyl-[acyl-carrier protein] reductase
VQQQPTGSDSTNPFSRHPDGSPHGIAVASVAPGFIATERIAQRFGPTLPASVTADSPLGRVGTSEEVNGAYYFR